LDECKKKGDDTVKILKSVKMWLVFKLLGVVRDAIDEEIEKNKDEEIERALNETLVEFYVKNDIDGKDRELINQFVRFAKEDLVPHLLEKLERYLRESR